MRDYGFVYDGVRAHGGMAFFPLLRQDGGLDWLHNDAYTLCTLVRKPPEPYAQLGLRQDMPIYTQFVRDPDAFLFVSRPQLVQEAWKDFTP